MDEEVAEKEEREGALVECDLPVERWGSEQDGYQSWAKRAGQHWIGILGIPKGALVCQREE